MIRFFMKHLFGMQFVAPAASIRGQWSQGRVDRGTGLWYQK